MITASHICSTNRAGAIRWVAAVAAVAASLLVSLSVAPAVASGAIASCEPGVLPGGAPAPEPAPKRLRFGIYPLAEAGQVGPPLEAIRPERPRRRERLLRSLRGDHRPFFVHLYKVFTNGPRDPENRVNMRALRQLTRRGFRAEVVLAYRPADGGGTEDVDDFVDFVRSNVARIGANNRVRAIQVTNEVNSTGAPDAADGYYAGARDALIRGIVAADGVVRRRGYRRLQIGFNWYYRLDPDAEHRFWSYLRDRGGPAFVQAVDWVGVDAYPGTWFPATVAPVGEVGDAGDWMVNAFSILRDCFMPLAGLPETVPIHVTENGYPTGPGRPQRRQARTLRAMAGATHEFRGTYNIATYQWFSLRDEDSRSSDLQQRYGIVEDDYRPKSAFRAYKRVIDRYGR